MASTQMTRALLHDMLLFAKTAGADGDDPLLLGAKAGLFINNIVPNVDTVLADLTVCSITGYALSGSITWLGPTRSNETDLPCIRGGLLVFTMTTQPDPPQTLYGAYLVDGGGTILLGVMLFDTPITPEDGTVVEIVPRLGLQDTSLEPAGLLTLT